MEIQAKDGGVELGEIHVKSKATESDDAALSRLGKKPVLKVSLFPRSIKILG